MVLDQFRSKQSASREDGAAPSVYVPLCFNALPQLRLRRAWHGAAAVERWVLEGGLGLFTGGGGVCRPSPRPLNASVCVCAPGLCATRFEPEIAKLSAHSGGGWAHVDELQEVTSLPFKALNMSAQLSIVC